VLMPDPTRVLFFSGYSHSSHHRKVELLADAKDFEILHVVQPGSGRSPDEVPSANGAGSYRVVERTVRNLGAPGDPHRWIHWPPQLHMADFRPHIVHCEHEQESLVALEVALAQHTQAPQSRLILYSWQNLLRRRSLPVQVVSRFTLLAADHMLCASREAVEVLRRQGYTKGASIMPLTGIDVGTFRPAEASNLRVRLDLAGFVAGYVGRLVPEKGVDLLLHAAAASHVEVTLLIVGDGPERAALDALSARLGIAARCRFAGGVSYDRMSEYLNALDVLVLPSRTTPNWKEQFGRVLAEAMACAKPVIGAASGAIPEVIGNAGLTFAEGDAGQLSRLIDLLAMQPALCAELGRRGRQRVETQYATEAIAGEIVHIWRQLAPTHTRDIQP
jgi:glycosyltransferase involved in cell wall biosynthesis